MARIWKQAYQEVAGDRLNLFVSMAKPRQPIEWVYFVHVCSFQFTFTSVEQISEYLTHFSHKLQPSNRWQDYSHLSQPINRKQDPQVIEAWERQRRYAKLPLFLWEEPKRRKVVDALTRAVKQFSCRAMRR